MEDFFFLFFCGRSACCASGLAKAGPGINEPLQGFNISGAPWRDSGDGGVN